MQLAAQQNRTHPIRKLLQISHVWHSSDVNQALSISVVHLTKFLNVLLMKFCSTNVYRSCPASIITFKQVRNLRKSNRYPVALCYFRSLDTNTLIVHIDPRTSCDEVSSCQWSLVCSPWSESPPGNRLKKLTSFLCSPCSLRKSHRTRGD